MIEEEKINMLADVLIDIIEFYNIGDVAKREHWSLCLSLVKSMDL
jgi:hypothetical protein